MLRIWYRRIIRTIGPQCSTIVAYSALYCRRHCRHESSSSMHITSLSSMHTRRFTLSSSVVTCLPLDRLFIRRLKIQKSILIHTTSAWKNRKNTKLGASASSLPLPPGLWRAARYPFLYFSLTHNPACLFKIAFHTFICISLHFIVHLYFCTFVLYNEIR